MFQYIKLPEEKEWQTGPISPIKKVRSEVIWSIIEQTRQGTFT
jgi:hypothetical protein